MFAPMASQPRIGLHYTFQAPGGDSEGVIKNGFKRIAKADELGLSSVLFGEQHFRDDGWPGRPLMLAAAAAAITTNMRVGSDIVVLPLHHPVAVAEETALLDVLSGGRAILGVGLGSAENEFDGFGVAWAERSAVYDRSTKIVRDLLDDKIVDVDIPPYAGRGAQIRPLPVNPHGVPLWIGALADRGVRRAAVVGDAWVVPPILRESALAAKKQKYDEARAEAGLAPVAERPMRRDAFVAETDDEAWRLFTPAIRYLFGTVWRAFDPTYPDHDTASALRSWGEELFLIGTPETVANRAAAIAADFEVTEFLLRFDVPEIADGAINECLVGLGEVVRLLDSAPQSAATDAAGLEKL
jgi:alkanesulfonate monooxygenase SsuD/methylene tetrahydromethanopterin reductase-like flavin-dependent oxidoreductase (luciferase family)